MTVVSELHRLLAEATSGPWRAEIDGYHTLYVAGERKLLPGQGRRFQTVAEGPLLDRAGKQWWEQDAALIVALRNHADALLDVAATLNDVGVWLSGGDLTGYEVVIASIENALARLDGKETP